MASNLYSSMMGATPPPRQDMLSAFSNFKRQMTGKDPKAMVEELVASGQMSKEQFNQLGQKANTLMGFLK